jgi:transcriptional regulator with XRE-family HTH domain
MNPQLTDSEAQLREFSRRLHAFMREKKLSQSELAANAFGCKTDYRGVLIPRKRDQVSAYVTGKRLPNQDNLLALAKALGIDPEDLLPDATKAPVDRSQSPVQFTLDADGKVRLRIDQLVDQQTAAQVMALLFARDKA